MNLHMFSVRLPCLSMANGCFQKCLMRSRDILQHLECYHNIRDMYVHRVLRFLRIPYHPEVLTGAHDIDTLIR